MYQWWTSELVELNVDGVFIIVDLRTGPHVVRYEQNNTSREQGIVAGQKRVDPAGREEVDVAEPHYHHARILH